MRAGVADGTGLLGPFGIRPYLAPFLLPGTDLPRKSLR
jgi:hypothetical protein